MYQVHISYIIKYINWACNVQILAISSAASRGQDIRRSVRSYAQCGCNQSVTSRLETSRYRDFSQFVESIGLGLENFGLEKKSRYRSRKYLVSKKSLSLGLENFGLEKKSRYRSR